MLQLLVAGASVSKAQAGVVGTELWCVAKNNAEHAALQTVLDWACGPCTTNCSPIQQGGPCYDASDIMFTASNVFNDYSLNPSQSQKLSFLFSFLFSNWEFECLEGY